MQRQRETAEKFRALHARGRLLILPNAWDAASAKLAETACAEAIATSSAALAWSHGYADGQFLPATVFLAAVREIVRIAKVPVTVDSEMGFADTPDGTAQFVMALAEAGVVGINIEDRASPPELLAAKIKAIKTAAKAKGADIFINARTDVYLHNLVNDGEKVAEVIRRGKLYAEAGADGLFVPALNDLAGLREVANAIDLPINVLTMKATPPVAQLKEAGVRRVSAGAGPGRAAYGAAARAMKMLMDEGKYDAMFSSAADCPDFNKLFETN
ncbi:MAG: isocitrate lyase/phosphoenolpyruvate mutase family protein [Rhizomicrobium sp.]